MPPTDTWATDAYWSPDGRVVLTPGFDGHLQVIEEGLKTAAQGGRERLILGTPLIADAFHGNRWDYVYRYVRQGRTLEERTFLVEFR